MLKFRMHTLGDGSCCLLRYSSRVCTMITSLIATTTTTKNTTTIPVMFIPLVIPSVFSIRFKPLGGLPPFTRPKDTTLRGKDLCLGRSMVMLLVLLLVKREEKLL